MNKEEKYIFVISIFVFIITCCLVTLMLDINTQTRRFIYEYEYVNNVKCEIEYRKGWVCMKGSDK